ncbi:MAG: inosine monophosphate cyclohydrolase, partial [Clostridiales bacterium]
GQGQLIHTYQKDGQPLPAFAGEPVTCAIPNNIDELTEYIWEGLNEQNRISLCVRYLNTDGSFQQRILNKNGGR